LSSPFNAMIFNLSVNEMLASGVGVPVDLDGALAKGARSMRGWPCSLTGFAHTTAGMSAVFTLTWLAMYRFCAVRNFPWER